MLAVALHRQLLQIGREALQILLVGQDGDGLRAEEIGVPERQQPHQHRQVLLERRGAEVLVHLHGSRRACRGSCPGRSRSSSTGRSPNPSNSGRRPSPRTRTCSPCRCRTSPPRRRWSKRRRNAWRPLSRRRQTASAQSRARLRIGHRFQRREGFRGDDEQRLGRIQIAHRLGEIGAIDVGDKAERHRRGRCSDFSAS